MVCTLTTWQKRRIVVHISIQALPHPPLIERVLLRIDECLARFRSGTNLRAEKVELTAVSSSFLETQWSLLVDSYELPFDPFLGVEESSSAYRIRVTIWTLTMSEMLAFSPTAN